MMNRNLKIVISGGGTGGHVFPAIAIADALREKVKDITILFVGASGKLEMTAVPDAGYEIIGLPVQGFQRRVTYKNIIFFINLIVSLIRTRSILNRFKPDVVVGVGGYASGPLVKVAAMMKIPVLIQEQNSCAGITNRLLAGSADTICVAYDNMNKYFPDKKIVLTGNPVRRDLTGIVDKKAEAFRYFGIPAGKKILLVIGGSLGARTINQSVIEKIDKIPGSNMELLWQTGRDGYAKAKSITEIEGYDFVHVFEFIKRMDLAFSIADLVISRAGAGTLSELAITGKPSILVPSPNVAEDHQTKNATALAMKDAAVVVPDSDAREKLIETALELAGNKSRLLELSNNIKSMAFYNSADRIASEVLKLTEKERN